MKKRMMCILLAAVMTSGLAANGTAAFASETAESATAESDSSAATETSSANDEAAGSEESPQDILAASVDNWHSQPVRGYQVSYESPSGTGGWCVTIDEPDAQAMSWSTDADGGNASPSYYVNQTLDQVKRGTMDADGNPNYGNSIVWRDGTKMLYSEGNTYADYTEQYSSLAECSCILASMTGMYSNANEINTAFEFEEMDGKFEQAEGITTSDGQNCTAYSFQSILFLDTGISVYFCLDPDNGELLEISYNFPITEDDFTDETGDMSYTVKFITGENCRKIALDEDTSGIEGFVQQQ